MPWNSAKRRVDADRAVQEQPGETWIAGGVDQFRLADRLQHAFGRAGIAAGILAASVQVFGQAHLDLAAAIAEGGVQGEDIIGSKHWLTPK